MTYCDEYAALISAGVDDALTADERRKLMDHLAACPACREAYTQMLAMHEAFTDWEEDVPGDLAGDVMAQIRKETPAAKRRKRSWLPVAAAAACCALVFIGYQALPRTVEKMAANNAMVVSESTDNSAMFDSADAISTDDAAVYTETDTTTADSECEEHILAGVLTYFRGAPIAPADDAEAAANELPVNDLAAEDDRSVPILTCSESALVDWMTENTDAVGYTSEAEDTGAVTTAWLITLGECEALTSYLDNAGFSYSTAWEQFHAQLPLPEEADLVCVVYLPAQANN